MNHQSQQLSWNVAYNAIANLIVVCPDAFNKDVNLIVSYFSYLHGATSELHNPIRGVRALMNQKIIVRNQIHI